MTSKTFKSAVSEGRLSIEEAPCGLFTVGIRRDGVVTDVVDLAPSDAPALMQAIVECLPPIPEIVRDGSYEAYMAVVVTYLDKAVRALEAETAEAKEQAELEAEAFNLYRAYMAVHAPMNAIGDWQMLAERTKEKWLAVVRKSRELRAEK